MNEAPPKPTPRGVAMALVAVGALGLILTALGVISSLGMALSHPEFAGPLLLNPWALPWVALQVAVSWLLLRGGMLLLGLGPPASTEAQRFYAGLLVACGTIGLVLSGLCTAGFFIFGLSTLGDSNAYGWGAVFSIGAIVIGGPALLVEWLMVRGGKALQLK